MLHCLLQRLEDSVLKDSEDYTVRGEDSNPSKIPARIREIITKNLADDIETPKKMSTPTTGQLTEENRILAAELNRVEDLLAASRAERDELGIKYNALSDKVCTSMGVLMVLSFTAVPPISMSVHMSVCNFPTTKTQKPQMGMIHVHVWYSVCCFKCQKVHHVSEFHAWHTVYWDQGHLCPNDTILLLRIYTSTYVC